MKKFLHVITAPIIAIGLFIGLTIFIIGPICLVFGGGYLMLRKLRGKLIDQEDLAVTFIWVLLPYLEADNWIERGSE